MNSNMEKARPFNVLFLCRDNSARSIMAEALLNALGQGRFQAHSAGPHPSAEISPYALAALKKAGIATAGLYSKSWDEFADLEGPELDFVFALCDGLETSPLWPSQPLSTLWSVPDPAAIEGSEPMKHLAFAECLRMLHNRIGVFTALPLHSLDAMSLQNRLDGIGKGTARSAA